MKFGEDLNMDTENVREQIKTALEEVGSRLRHERKDTRWTLEVKLALARLGQGRFEVCCIGDGKERDWPEWLYDMCWLERSDKSKPFYTAMPLAMECEWNTDLNSHVLPDFQKLVFSTAKIRLLIWQAGNLAELEKGIALFREQIRQANSDPAAYLFAGWDGVKLNFVFY
jgi:hypothetical protein